MSAPAENQTIDYLVGDEKLRAILANRQGPKLGGSSCLAPAKKRGLEVLVGCSHVTSLDSGFAGGVSEGQVGSNTVRFEKRRVTKVTADGNSLGGAARTARGR